MKRIAPVLLIIAGLAILVSVFLFCNVQGFNRLNDEIHELQLVLGQKENSLILVTESLIQANEALERERAIVISGQGLRNFLSLDELKEFLAEDDTDEQDYVATTFDCDDFALMLQRHAFEKGFIISCQILPVEGIEHMCNMAICGNDIYYIEAETDEVRYANFLD